MSAQGFTRLRTEGKAPSARGGHTATLVESSLVVMGGTAASKADEYAYFSLDPVVLDVANLKWFTPRLAIGAPPEPRAYHSASRVGSAIYVFGGQRAKAQPLGDLQIFDLRAMAWTKAEARGAPPRPRYWHSSAHIDGKLFVIGGYAGGESLADLHVLDAEALHWSSPKLSGSPLPALSSHTCTVVGQRLYIYGGMGIARDEAGDTRVAYQRDLHVVDLESLSAWRQRARGEQPSARAYHESVLVGGYMLILGGWSGAAQPVGVLPALDLDGLGAWYSVEVPGSSPPPMYGHTATLIGSKVLLFGGWDGFSPTSSTHVLDTTAL